MKVSVVMPVYNAEGTVLQVLENLRAQTYQPLEIVVINTAESEDKVFAFLAGVAPDLNPLMDRDGLVTERWQPRGLPATFLVDPSGRLQYLALGGRPWDSPDYLKFLQKLIDIK